MPNYASETGKRAALGRLAALYEQDPHPALVGLRRGAWHYVPGRGSVFPRLVIVGEAPGKTEDRTKTPFCGASGRVLDELLESVALSRDDIWITNAVKYRPTDREGNNRTPTGPELEASKAYLAKELVILNCPFVLTLGKQPLSVFLGNRPHDVVRAKWRPVGFGNRAYHLLPLYHPAVAIYQRAKKPLLLKEFQVVKERVPCS